MNIKSSKSIINAILLTGFAFGISIAYASYSGTYTTDDVPCTEAILDPSSNPNLCYVDNHEGTIITNSVSARKKCFQRYPGQPYCITNNLIECFYICAVNGHGYTNHVAVINEIASPIPPYQKNDEGKEVK